MTLAWLIYEKQTTHICASESYMITHICAVLQTYDYTYDSQSLHCTYMIIIWILCMRTYMCDHIVVVIYDYNEFGIWYSGDSYMQQIYACPYMCKWIIYDYPYMRIFANIWLHVYDSQTLHCTYMIFLWIIYMHICWYMTLIYDSSAAHIWTTFESYTCRFRPHIYD